MTQAPPSLVLFESCVAARDHAGAVHQALQILQTIDEAMGAIEGVGVGGPAETVSDSDQHVRFATRFAAAFGELLTQPGVTIAAPAVEMLFVYHRWCDLMFALSGFQTSSHLISRLGEAPDGTWTLSGSSMVQFLLFFSPSSTLEIDLDQCYAANPAATVLAALGYLSARVCVTERAGAFRERLLDWLPGKLDGLTLGRIRLSFTTEIYMHCSYAAGAGKHRIKADLIAQMRKACLAAGAREVARSPPRRERPRIVVVAEHFHAGHSVFRTHSRAVRALRERFEVIGVAYGERTDEAVRVLFDEPIVYPPGDVIDGACAVANAIREREPDIVFHLGVGMSNHVIALASLRLAPIQCVSFGHTATTMSPAIDYVVLPDDFIGAEDRFSETVLALPARAMPYAPPDLGEAPAPRACEPPGGGPLRIAVPAAVMKLNARFLAALAEIAERASRPVTFAFFPLASTGLVRHYLDQEIRRVLPGAIVHAEAPRAVYLERLGECAAFLCPFPYGNMNSIIDAVSMGVPGVCLDGEEAHAHADVAIFQRLGLPPALSAADLEAYIAAAVRLIDDAEWRTECRRIAGAVDLEACFYAGDERLFCEAIYGLLP